MVLNTNMALHFLKYEKVVKKKSHNCGDKMQKDYSSHNPFNGHTASSCNKACKHAVCLFMLGFDKN